MGNVERDIDDPAGPSIPHSNHSAFLRSYIAIAASGPRRYHSAAGLEATKREDYQERADAHDA